MKTVIPFLFFLIILSAGAQEIPAATEEQLENLSVNESSDPDDDALIQQLQEYRKNPLNLNATGEQELAELRVLSPLQILNFISYRRIFGAFLHVYELQAIPGWEINTIKKLLPFISISTSIPIKEEFKKILREGDHSIVLRGSHIPKESSAGFQNNYLGGPLKLFFRYRYRYKNTLQWGLVGEKDAGEQFFAGKQKAGFDFYSMHCFIRGTGMLRAVALGDFSINLGQGLVHWQSLGFKKSSDAMGIKRQSAVLRPYNSGGEFFFHRGVAITAQKKDLETTFFLSVRKLSANLDTDTAGETRISSFISSGLFRTASEVLKKNNTGQTGIGGNIVYRQYNWHIGLNAVHFVFSRHIQKRDEPYNYFAFHGRHATNFSTDYSYTWKNLHFFGETAIDKKLNTAIINGLLISVDRSVDLSILQRTISGGYSTIYGNAFTENTSPTNESGLYAGVSLRPINGIRIDAYADIYRFPWLKYLVNAPSSGRDFCIQLTHTPNKQVEIYSRYRVEVKQGNAPADQSYSRALTSIMRKNWRIHLNYRLNKAIELRNRFDLIWYKKYTAAAAPGSSSPFSTGFLTYADFLYRPLLQKFAGNFRIMYFETDSYDSRLYAYENDILYIQSIPAFYDQGLRYYINTGYELGNAVHLWLKWAHTIYTDPHEADRGTEEIESARKIEIKVQILLKL